MFHCVFRLQKYEVIIRRLKELLPKSMFQMFCFRSLQILRILHHIISHRSYCLLWRIICMDWIFTSWRPLGQCYLVLGFPLWTHGSYIFLVERTTVCVLSCIHDNKLFLKNSKYSGWMTMLVKPTGAPIWFAFARAFINRVIISDIRITLQKQESFFFIYFSKYSDLNGHFVKFFVCHV